MASLMGLRSNRSYDFKPQKEENIEMRGKNDSENQENKPMKASTNKTSPSQPTSPKKEKFGRGYKVVYLGNVPTYESGGPDPTAHLVEKLLDACNVQECRMKDAFLDIKSYGLLMYYVDEQCKINNSKFFDLARISYCQVHINGGLAGQGSIVSWIYRQETDSGFQLHCHAVQCTTSQRAHTICSKLYHACHTLYREVQLAMQTSRLFAEASKKLTPIREQEVPDARGQYWNEGFDHIEDEDRSVLEGQLGQLQFQQGDNLVPPPCSSSESTSLMTSSFHTSSTSMDCRDCPSSPSLCSLSSSQEVSFVAEVHASDSTEDFNSTTIIDEAPNPTTNYDANINDDVFNEDGALNMGDHKHSPNKSLITDFKLDFLPSANKITPESFAENAVSSLDLCAAVPNSNKGFGEEMVSEDYNTQSNVSFGDNSSKLNESEEPCESDSSFEECVLSDSDMDTGLDCTNRVDV